MCSGMGDRTCLLPGFPIRKSSDHSSVGSSPRLIAASYVLHRLLVPRHPPCALNNLATKMLASTVQFSRYGQTQPRPHRAQPAPDPTARHGRRSVNGWSRPAHTTTPPPEETQPRHGAAVRTRSEETGNPAPSGPNSVPTTTTPPTTLSHPPEGELYSRDRRTR